LTFRLGFFLRAGACAGLVVLLGWAAARKLETAGPARAPLARRAGAARRRAVRTAPSGSVRRDAGPELAELCARVEDGGAGEAAEECYCDAVAGWMAAHSHSAGKMIRELDVPPPVRLRLEAQLMAERDFASAYAWADRLPDPAGRISALSSVLYEGALEAPGAVLEFAREADLGDRKALVLGTILRRWRRTDSAAAEDWLGSAAGAGRVW